MDPANLYPYRRYAGPTYPPAQVAEGSSRAGSTAHHLLSQTLPPCLISRTPARSPKQRTYYRPAGCRLVVGLNKQQHPPTSKPSSSSSSRHSGRNEILLLIRNWRRKPPQVPKAWQLGGAASMRRRRPPRIRCWAETGHMQSPAGLDRPRTPGSKPNCSPPARPPP